MRTLLLGGTRFLGRAIADGLLARGHAVTLFHRGRSNPGLFPEAAHVIGDRELDLERLAGRTFDAVIDTNGFEVPSVRRAARAIAAARYVFVSTISVYADRMDEAAPLQSMEGAETATLDLHNYGALKAACERALEEELPGRVLSIRAGKIDGPHDLDERFRYWLTRIAEGGEVLAPGDPQAIVQTIDVRDLARFIVRATEDDRRGVVNATGAPMTMEQFLSTIREVVGGGARFTWVPDEVLAADGVGAYSEMPYWIPGGRALVPIDRALSFGLTLRPFVDTVRDTWSWMQRSWSDEAHVRALRRLRVPAGIDRARESRLLAASTAPVPSAKTERS